MANEVVKFNNDMNTVALRKFNSTEINLLMSICSRVRDQDLKYVEFDFNYLKTLIKYPYNDINSFVNTLDSAYNKLLKCNIRIGNDIKWTRFVLFTKYTIDVENQTVTIGVNEEFKYVLNELTSNFTRFELEEFVDFKSTYTKEFYRRMKQFKYTGVWIVSIEEFKNFLDIPQNYKIDTIDKKVFKPIMNELGKEFNLKIIKKYKKVVVFINRCVAYQEHLRIWKDFLCIIKCSFYTNFYRFNSINRKKVQKACSKFTI